MNFLPRTLASAVLAIGLGAFGARQTTTALSQAFGPRFKIHVSRPVLQWQVWSRKSTVTHVDMDIDSRPVHARYDDAQHSILYTPEQALTAGPHHVDCSVIFDGGATFTKAWDFTVAPDAVSSLPAPNEMQSRLLDLVNARRRQLGLVKVKIDDRLDAAAAAHVAYLAQNDETGHGESPNSPGYSGQTGGARCEAFGWCTGVFEGVTVGESLPEHAVRDLFDAPYHRIPFMQPGAVSFGGDSRDARTTVLFSRTVKTGIEVSPSDGEEGVPIRWENHENPSPLRDHTDRPICGYPIVIAGFSPEKKPLHVAWATLETTDGQNVPAWLQTPDTDSFLTNAAILIPRDPLLRGVVYTAKAEVTFDGRTATRTWSFSTAR